MVSTSRTRSTSSRRDSVKAIENKESEALLDLERSRSRSRNKAGPGGTAKNVTPNNNNGYITKIEVEELLDIKEKRLEKFLCNKIADLVKVLGKDKKNNCGTNLTTSPRDAEGVEGEDEEGVGGCGAQDAEGGEEASVDGCGGLDKYDKLEKKVNDMGDMLTELMTVLREIIVDKKPNNDDEDDENDQQSSTTLLTKMRESYEDSYARHSKTEKALTEITTELAALRISMDEDKNITQEWPKPRPYGQNKYGQGPFTNGRRNQSYVDDDHDAYLAQLRIRKSRNLIIFRLNENFEFDENEQNISDFEDLKAIFNDMGIIERLEKCIGIKRLGVRSADNTRSRPLMLQFPSVMDRDFVLNNAKELKNSQYNVSICKDLTKEDREIQKANYLKRKQQKENPSNLVAGPESTAPAAAVVAAAAAIEVAEEGDRLGDRPREEPPTTVP